MDGYRFYSYLLTGDLGYRAIQGHHWLPANNHCPLLLSPPNIDFAQISTIYRHLCNWGKADSLLETIIDRFLINPAKPIIVSPSLLPEVVQFNHGKRAMPRQLVLFK